MRPDLEKSEGTAEKSSRASIINAVETPLGFFALVVLVVEAILGFTAYSSNGNDKTFMLIGMLILIFLLVFIVAWMAVSHPPSLYGKSATPPVSSIAETDLVVVSNPKILLASSVLADLEQAQQDVKILQKAFPKSVVAQYNLRSQAFFDLLIGNKFDIVQLYATVKGDGSVEFMSGDRVPGNAVQWFLELRNTRLLILTCCNSIPLAAVLSSKINMIAATGSIPDDAFKRWEKVFYELLSTGHPLSRASRLANYSLGSFQLSREGEASLSILPVMKQDVVFKKQP